MTRCLPGRHGRRSRGKAGGAGERHSVWKKQQEGRHRGRNCRSGGRGTLTILVVLLELVPEAVAREGGRGRLMRGTEGRGISGAPQWGAEPEGRLPPRKRRLLADPSYAHLRTIVVLTVAPKGTWIQGQRRSRAEGGLSRGEGPRPGVLEAATHSRAVHSWTSDFCSLLCRPPGSCQDGAKGQMRNDKVMSLANCKGPDEWLY